MKQDALHQNEILHSGTHGPLRLHFTANMSALCWGYDPPGVLVCNYVKWEKHWQTWALITNMLSPMEVVFSNVCQAWEEAKEKMIGIMGMFMLFDYSFSWSMISWSVCHVSIPPIYFWAGWLFWFYIWYWTQSKLFNIIQNLQPPKYITAKNSHQPSTILSRYIEKHNQVLVSLEYLAWECGHTRVTKIVPRKRSLFWVHFQASGKMKFLRACNTILANSNFEFFFVIQRCKWLSVEYSHRTNRPIVLFVIISIAQKGNTQHYNSKKLWKR